MSHTSASLRPLSKLIDPASLPLMTSVAVPSTCIWRACSAYAVSALSPRIVACVLLHSPYPLRFLFRKSTAARICGSYPDAGSRDALINASVASEVVSIASDSPPDIVIDSFAPVNAPSLPCIATSRLTIAPVSPALGAARSAVFVASASRYGSLVELPSALCTPSSVSMPPERFASDSAHMMYAFVTSSPARPNESSASVERANPPL